MASTRRPDDATGWSLLCSVEERAAKSLITPPHNSPGTPEPAASPAHHHQNPDTPVRQPNVGDGGCLLTDDPEFSESPKTHV